MRTFLRLVILAPIFFVGAPITSAFVWLLGDSYRETMRDLWWIYRTGDLPPSAE